MIYELGQALEKEGFKQLMVERRTLSIKKERGNIRRLA
jgi:hypothetical protein